MCFSRIGHLTLNVSSGRMSLWTAATKKRENLKAILYVFADCNGCGLLRTQGKIEKQYCMSLQTAMIVFGKCRRSDCNDCVC